MGVIAAAVQNLIKAGVTGDALVSAIADMEAAAKPRRSAGAERTARYRERQADASHVTHVTHEEIPPTPPKETTTSPKVEVVNNPPTRVRARRIPDDFSPSLLVAEELGLSREDADAEAANFLDYWRAKSSNAAKRDWPATWRIWCRKAVTDRARGSRGPPRQKEPGMGALWAEFERKRNARAYETPAGSGDAAMGRGAGPSGNGHGAEWGRSTTEPSSGRQGPIIDIEVEPKLSRSE